MATVTTNRDADYAQMFASGRQIDLTHFYSIGDLGREEYEFFAYGYFTGEVFVTGKARFDGEVFDIVG